jgi:transcriptional regulator with XRE-family HTH domain
MTLKQVEQQSGGRWTVEVLGSYERGHRAVTVVRLADLAEFYGMPTDELLPTPPAVVSPAVGDRRLAVDLERLAELPARKAGPLARYASAIQRQRDDSTSKFLTIREADLHSLAVIYDQEPDALASMLVNWGVLTTGPATRGRRPRSRPRHATRRNAAVAAAPPAPTTTPESPGPPPADGPPPPPTG